MLEVTLLSVLQGVAEFLPISSSGHLVIAQHFLGVDAPGLRLDIFLHVGTLASIVLYYWCSVVRMLREAPLRYGIKIIASTLPAVVVYFFCGDSLKSAFENVRLAGMLLVLTGIVLVVTRFLPRGERDVSFLRAFLMGCAQAFALLPGVSRSGMTLVAARAAKVDSEKAAEFSFLMSAPLIAGAALLEMWNGMCASAHEAEVGWGLVLYGAILSAVVGYFSLKFLVATLKGRWFWLFGPYCLAAGTLVLLFA